MVLIPDFPAWKGFVPSLFPVPVRHPKLEYESLFCLRKRLSDRNKKPWRPVDGPGGWLQSMCLLPERRGTAGGKGGYSVGLCGWRKLREGLHGSPDHCLEGAARDAGSPYLPGWSWIFHFSQTSPFPEAGPAAPPPHVPLDRLPCTRSSSASGPHHLLGSRQPYPISLLPWSLAAFGA